MVLTEFRLVISSVLTQQDIFVRRKVKRPRWQAFPYKQCHRPFSKGNLCILYRVNYRLSWKVYLDCQGTFSFASCWQIILKCFWQKKKYIGIFFWIIRWLVFWLSQKCAFLSDISCYNERPIQSYLMSGESKMCYVSITSRFTFKAQTFSKGNSYRI